jgi:hypothetical protein
MSLFKGALYLVDQGPDPEPLSQGFEGGFGNAAATRQWLQTPFNAETAAMPLAPDAATPVRVIEDEALDCTG